MEEVTSVDFLKKYIVMFRKKYILALMFLTLEAMCDLMQPTIMSKIIDKGVAAGKLDYVLKLGGVMLFITLLGALAAVTRNIISSNVSQRFGSQLRQDLFKKVQSFSFNNIDKFEGASLIIRLTNDVNQVQAFAHGTMRIFVKAPILCIGSLIMAVAINPYMSFILIGIVPIIGGIIFLNMRISYPFFIRIQSKLDKVNSVMREYLAGVRVVKAFNQFEYEINRFDTSNKELSEASIKGMRVMSVFSPVTALSVNLGIVLVLWLGGIRVNNGKMQVGEIIAFINYMTQILFSLVMISHVLNMFIRAKASAERIGEIFSEVNNIEIKEEPVTINPIEGNIDFENVSFSYEGSKGKVLKNINFSCREGELVGIIGSTGSGKSSLINLIPRFYDATSGKISIDGIDIRDLDLNNLRKSIAVVPQKTTLFTGSILDNIRWGKEDASMHEVIEAAKVAQSHEFISSFKDGYYTELGQGGVNLSGGQKQRIAIARALIKKPGIIIFDDSTSAVDTLTEEKIRIGLKEYLKDTTCILIAQRITSIMKADQIIVLDNGTIVGTGTHEELIKSCETYKDLFYSQLGRREYDGI